MGETFRYVGDELSLFAKAANWKAYLRTQLAPFLRGDVLEVGAGLGGTTRALWSDVPSSWTCLEPDAKLAGELRENVGSLEGVRVLTGTCADLAPGSLFDTVLYIDVLEHILDDAGELAAVSRHLKPGGVLAVMSPAHQWLFTPFDTAVGHHRRYERRSLARVAPRGLELVELRYLDSVGLLASLGNRFLLRSAEPTSSQIALWDRFFVSASRVLDGALGYRLGKSILAVWRAPSAT